MQAATAIITTLYSVKDGNKRHLIVEIMSRVTISGNTMRLTNIK